MINSVYVYGDSILRGTILDSSKKTYYSMKENIAQKLQEKFNICVNNKAKFGRTILKGAREIKAMLRKNEECDLVVLEYGGNDCDHRWCEVSINPEGEHIPNTPIDIFEKVYNEIISEIKSKGIQVAVTSLPPIDSERYFNWVTQNGLNKDNVLMWLKDKQTIAHYQELYSLTATKVALQNNCIYIDIRSEFLKQRDYREFMCEDGIHPNEKGQQLIEETISKYLNSHIAI
ncbi:SGNH/GDSL hydrolase family protein [Clostridium sp.]|uniref:SGNH/GDSL hydrolase family protein n=1 Tax=Clostridium sp. TaxID=1506 RepID=UPI002FC5B0BE